MSRVRDRPNHRVNHGAASEARLFSTCRMMGAIKLPDKPPAPRRAEKCRRVTKASRAWASCGRATSRAPALSDVNASARTTTLAGRCRSSIRLGKKFADAIGTAQMCARIPRDASQGRTDDSHPTSTSAQSSRGLLLVGDFSTTILTGGRDLRESAARREVKRQPNGVYPRHRLFRVKVY
jgi:hypothetical protein